MAGLWETRSELDEPVMLLIANLDWTEICAVKHAWHTKHAPQFRLQKEKLHPLTGMH